MINDLTFLNIIKENLKAEQVVKSYKEMCNLLHEDIKTGNAKKSQLARWERFFKWEMKGHKFMILEIYDNPLDKIETRGGEREIIHYIKEIEKFHINLLVQAKNNQVTLPKSLLFELLCMVNENYRAYHFNTTQLSEKTNINKKDIDEFYASSSKMLKGNLDKSLNNLQRKNMIFWSQVLTVKLPEDEGYTYEECYREASNDEYEFVMKTKDKVLKEMGLSEEWQVFQFDRWNEYQRKLNKILMDEIGVEYAFESYDIKLNREKIKNEWYKLDEKDKMIDRKAINSGVLERALKLANDRRDGAIKWVENRKGWGDHRNDKVKRRVSKEYMDNYKQLGQMLLKIDWGKI